jgi:formylglycine-generating enzyme required for sulfatase activity
MALVGAGCLTQRTETKPASEAEPVSETETILLPGGVPLEMVWIPAGTFLMGSHEIEQARYVCEGPRHSVTLSGFWMGKYELTKAQWTAVMGTAPWSEDSRVLNDPGSPAVNVTWDMMAGPGGFLDTLNAANPEMDFRLPSEAQWEYACRAGTKTRFYWGNDPNYTEIGGYAWYSGNLSGEQYAHTVGQRLPNAWGLYDMSGNVWEWCQDWWHGRYTDAPTDGSAWEFPTMPCRVYRGGSWSSPRHYCRSANRNDFSTDYTLLNTGARIVRIP